MATNLSGPLVLNEGVLIIPVEELSEETRLQVQCQKGDFAVSRIQSRNGSKIIDAAAANLLSLFQEKRTLVEAVIQFSNKEALKPESVLENAYPFLRKMVEGGFLLQLSDTKPTPSLGTELTGISAGTDLLGGRVLRTLHVLEDSEVFLLSRGSNKLSVFKIARDLPQQEARELVAARLNHEAKFLTYLSHSSLAPKLIGKGALFGRTYLEIEFIHGVDVSTACSEFRERKGNAARQRLLTICQEICRAYVKLHGRGILHGDVHPSNLIQTASGDIKLIDFGVAHSIRACSDLPLPPHRGGVPFFFEPEMARACLEGKSSLAASLAGEQHAIAACIYFIFTGAHWQNFRLGRQDMLQDLLELKPLSFSQRGTAPWPSLELVLLKALSKVPEDRFPTTEAFFDALLSVRSDPTSRTPQDSSGLKDLIDRATAASSFEGVWSKEILSPPPTTSINYGSAGVALGLLHLALSRDDNNFLQMADVWSQRAINEMGSNDAFYNKQIDITEELVGKCSPYHSPSGIYAVSALIGRACADHLAQAESLTRFIEAVNLPDTGLDLTLGRSGVLLSAAILLDATPADGFLDPSPLRSMGSETMETIWRELDVKPCIEKADIEYPGAAHGWAGFLYASLQWCYVAKVALPMQVERRLHELADLAIPSGRGLDWPWVIRRPGEPVTMAGWCNGACGFVFLWTLAHQILKDFRYLELARGAAYRSWESPENNVSLCCGVAGRAYALLNFYRHSKETIWLDRARDLTLRGARIGNNSTEYQHSLYKGEFGLAVLACDIEKPEDARMPLFEPLGYS
jgi:serine/threonine protein kinase